MINMIVTIATDAHFFKTPDGKIYTESINSYKFWMRYLDVFDKVIVLARVKNVDIKDNKWIISNGKNVEFCCLPDYLGPWQYLKYKNKIKNIVKECVKNSDKYILRVPSQIGTVAYSEIKKLKREYALEVGGDPWEALRKGTIKSIVRPFVRVKGTLELKKQCKEAKVVSYVTKYALQRRYPCKNKMYSCSDVEIKSEQIRKIPKSSTDKDYIEIVNVGSMNTLYKAQDIQIKAIKECIDRGYNVRLKLIGDGANRLKFEQLAKNLEIEDKVKFMGMIPGNHNVMNEIDSSDIFIMPSLVEGLPRALIEAMARGLPCIATDVGGIPELLDKEYLVCKNNFSELAKKIIELIDNKQNWIEYSEKNIEVAKEYKEEFLKYKRVRFYESIK